MDLLYACTDLLISRSGASTLSEIAVLGMPALLIPFPRAARNHQEANARVLAERGAALLMQDNELTGEKLYREIIALMRDEKRLVETGNRPGSSGSRIPRPCLLISPWKWPEVEALREGRVHFIGIGGAGVSAIAAILVDQGTAVSGSDLKGSRNTQRLEEAGAKCIPHRPGNVEGACLVVLPSRHTR